MPVPDATDYQAPSSQAAAGADAELFIGLMSGTSADGVDAVLLRASDPPRTLAIASLPFSSSLRQAIEALQQPGPDELHRAAEVSNALADAYGEAVAALLTQSGCSRTDIRALGAHGQTVRHRPESGYTLQLLNAARLAEQTGLPVVYDLRQADVAAGGQGAPLVPAFHASVFASTQARRAIVNIGGIANVSLLPRRSFSEPMTARGYDTGPGNTLLDAWHYQHRGGYFDEQGCWAASGHVDPGLLAAMLDDPYFSEPAPKSTGRDRFHTQWLAGKVAQCPSPLRPEDVQATLAELTALTIAEACAGLADEVYVCGGGAFNLDLLDRLQRHLAGTPVRSTDALGIAPLSVEGAAFAWLAWRRIHGQPGNLPAVTGARGERVLGAVALPAIGASVRASA